MHNYGIRGKCLCLLERFISSGYQYTEVSGTFSELSLIDNGVPQGSVLGPLFFLIYINHITCHLLSIQTINFADDAALICESKQPATHTNIKTLEDWLEKNKLSLSIDRTTSIFSGREITLSTNEQRSINIILNKGPGTYNS